MVWRWGRIAFDYYNSYVIQPMFVQVMQTVNDHKVILHDRSLEMQKKTEDLAKNVCNVLG